MGGGYPLAGASCSYGVEPIVVWSGGNHSLVLRARTGLSRLLVGVAETTRSRFVLVWGGADCWWSGGNHSLALRARMGISKNWDRIFRLKAI